MSESVHAPPPSTTTGHEPPDENFRLIVTTGAILAVVCAAAFVVCFYLVGYFLNREKAEKESQFPLAAEENRANLATRIRRVPEPLLEGFERHEGTGLDLRPRDLRASQQEWLQGYGPAEPPDPGYVRIPIDAAMRLILEGDRLPVHEKQGAKRKQNEEAP
jgi:hypothetical protein